MAGCAMLLLAACSFGVRPVAYDEGPPREAVSEFVSALKEGDNAAAHGMLTEETRSMTTLDEFDAERDEAERAGRGIERFEFPNPVVPVAGRATDAALSVPVRLHFEDGASDDIGLEVRNEGDEWRIHFPEG